MLPLGSLQDFHPQGVLYRTQLQEAVPDSEGAPIPPSPDGLQAWGNVVPGKRQMSSKRESQARQRSAPGDVSQNWEGRQGGKAEEGKRGGEWELC